MSVLNVCLLRFKYANTRTVRYLNKSTNKKMTSMAETEFSRRAVNEKAVEGSV
jgi:hypothetical protein